MKKLFFINVIILLLFSSCSNEEDCCFPGDDDIFEIVLLNASGENLLDPNTPGSFNTSKIKVFNILNGEKMEINNPNSDYPKGYNIIERNGALRFVPLFGNSNLDVSEGIIQWNEHEEDTITLAYSLQSENVRRLIRIFYNNEEVWNETSADNREERFFEIIK
jgi:hypothetical protein